MNFASLTEKTSQYGEINDCAVKALALCIGTSYEDAHQLAAEYGRTPGRGMYSHRYLSALASRGAEIMPVPLRKLGFKTVKSLGEASLEGTYLIETKGHVLVYKNGKVVDWTDNRQHRIVSAYRITFPNGAIRKEGAVIENLIVPLPRARTDKYNWKIIRLDTGETLKRYKRYPRKVAESLAMGGYYPSLGQSVKLKLVKL